MKKMLAPFLLASLLGMLPPSAPALAQTADPNAMGADGGSPAQQQQLAPTPGPDAPSPVTGELVPLPPGTPPEGGAANIKLPDCTPGKCGVPQIMSQ